MKDKPTTRRRIFPKFLTTDLSSGGFDSAVGAVLVYAVVMVFASERWPFLWPYALANGIMAVIIAMFSKSFGREWDKVLYAGLLLGPLLAGIMIVVAKPRR